MGSVTNASGNTGSVLVVVSSVHIIGVGNQLLRSICHGASASNNHDRLVAISRSTFEFI